ncbi:MAG: PAS domain S-box protein [bacterium]|nr:PAS domain S-box protein [bacterium]
MANNIRENREKSCKPILPGTPEYRALWDWLNQIPIPTCILQEDGTIIDYNEALAHFTGYSHEELSSVDQWVSLLYSDSDSRQAARNIFQNWWDGAEVLQKNEFFLVSKKHELHFVQYKAFPLCKAGNSNWRVLQVEDIGQSKQIEKRLQLALDIMTILNLPDKKHDTIFKILFLIKEATGMEAVGIRLKDGEDFPYYTTEGFNNEFVASEYSLCTRHKNGDVIRDDDGKPVLECMCGNVIRGRTDPALPFFTTHGSFWTNSTTHILATTQKGRNCCNKSGYESVALIPLSYEGGIIGLLQLNDKRKNLFKREMIQFFERVGTGIGIAFTRQFPGIKCADLDS